MLIHAAFGRGLWFFLPEWEFVLSMIRNPEQDVWWVPLRGDAVRNSPHLGFLFALGVIAAIECVSVVVSRDRSRHYVPLALHAGFLIELTIWTVWQVLGRHTTLLPSYFAHPLYGPACLSIGAMVDRHVQVRDRRLGWLAVVCMPIVTIFAISHAGRLDLSQAVLSSPFTVTAFAFGLFYVALAAGSSWGAGDRIVAGARLLPAAVLLPVAMASSAPAVLYARSECRLYPEFNRFIIDGSRDLTRLVEHSTDVYVWAAPDDVVPVPASCRRLWAGQVSDVVSSFAALGHRYVYQSSSGLTAAAELPLQVLRRIGDRPNVLIAVVAADETAPSRLRERFLSAGITLTETARRTSPPDVPLPIIFVFRPTVGPMPAGVRDLDSSR
jgi:hypothetical protein